MRIHEVLDACIEYVAYEGILGSDVLSLQQYLTKRDSSLDATSFAYLYTLLCQHPSIRIAISTYPLPSADKSVQPGTAPLPDDYSPPDENLSVDMGEMYRQGKRGRELAFHFAGEEYITSKEAVATKRARQERGRLEKTQGGTEVKEKEKKQKKKSLEQILGADGAVLFTFLEEDDAALGGDPVDASDLAGLAEKWGNRLRIRCTDDEIYFRLTGSHQKIPKLTLPVMHALQLAARSRERGITAIELGPMIGASQGSTYYYMKVLIEQGLCTKVPAVIHGSTTNLLIYHPFIELNETYRAIKNLGPIPVPVPEIAPEEDDDQDPAIDDSGGSATGLNFRPMSEAEYIIGHVVKERLIQLLDHPALQNHLLKSRNLHALVGWTTPTCLRQTRAMPRHIASLVQQGIVERLEVGPKRIDCLRLTKYNPDYTGPPEPKIEPVNAESSDLVTYSPRAYNQIGGIAMNRSFERQVLDIIIASDKAGATYSQIRQAMTGVYKRSLEFFLIRAEDSWFTPQLRGTALCSVMESYSKERRLRVFVVPAYRTFMLENRQTPDDVKHPPLTEEAGRWASLNKRDFAVDNKDFWRRAERAASGRDHPGSHYKPRIEAAASGKRTKERKDRPRDSSGKVIVSGSKRARSSTPSGDESGGESSGEDRQASKRPMLFYDSTVQVRGRPRKYIHVVDEEGKVRRMIIGQVHPHPDIPPVLIWVASVKKLVPAPVDYSGLGKPPAVTTEQLKLGHPPKWFEKFPKHLNKTEAAKAAKKKKSNKRNGLDEDDEANELDEDDQEADAEMREAVDGEEAQANGEAAELVNAGSEVVVEKRKARPRKAAAEAAKKSKRLSTAASVAEAGDEGTPPAPQKPSIDLSMIDPTLLDPVDGVTADSAPAAHANAARPSPLGSSSLQAQSVGYPAPMLGESSEYELGPSSSFAHFDAGAPVDFELPSEILDAATALKPTKSRKRARKEATPTEPNPADTSDNSILLPKPRKQPKRAPAVVQPTPTVDRAATPITSITTQASSAKAPAPPATTARPPNPASSSHPGRKLPVRLDMGLIRRNNELVETLRVNGGVLNDTRFVNAHDEWAHRVAGTDAPGAPLVGYRMDRRIFRLSIPILESEGRLKQTICSIPTTTGRWVKQQVCWLPETPKADVDAYISSLAEATISSQLLLPKKGRGTQIEDQAFSEVRVAGTINLPGSKATVIKNPMRDDSPATIRRNTLLKQPGVAATLLGYISGRWARVRHFFDALVGVLESETTTRISSSPYIFALPLIFEDISVGTFYECIHSTTYDEELCEWLSIPGNRALRLRDVPLEFRPPSGGFAGASSKAKYRTILTTLCQLGLLSPLNPSNPDAADMTIPTPDDPIYFKIPDHVSLATHFVIHLHAPVYHIAADPAGLLGILPVSTSEERAVYWSAVENACTQTDMGALQQLTCDAPIGLPQTARITERLDIDRETLRMMRSTARWRSDIRLLDEQREAIDQQIDWRRGIVKITSDEDLESFAYANALPLAFAREELDRRALQAKERAFRVARKEADKARTLRESRAKNQRSLREKLAEIRLQSKMDWEARILKAAETTGVEYTPEVVSFVTHHTLSVPNRAKLSDAAIESAVKLSCRVQATKVATSEKVEQKKDIWDRQATIVGGQRRRHAWNPFEDDLLLDAEAIIRARSRGRTRGRQAITQVFPDVGHQTLSSRFKKIMARPGKQQYFDRLEQAWYDLWVANRGLGVLVDDDPDNTAGFDLKHHIEFLRANVRKQELRLGPQPNESNVVQVDDLPADHAGLLRVQSWRYAKAPHHTLQSITDSVASEESKLAGYLALPLREETKEIGQPEVDRKRGIARACLKMIVSTSNEAYDTAAAAAFLSPFSSDERFAEINSLVDDKVFIKQHTAAHTSRHYAYTAIWNSVTDGPYPAELYSESKSLQSTLAAKGDEGVKWSSVCTSGDVAALLDMTSEGIVDIEFNASEFRPVRYLRNTYNTRAIDDDVYEFDLHIKQKVGTVIPNPLLPVPQLGPTLTPWSGQDSSIDVHDAVNRVLDLVHAAGPDGLTKSDLHDRTGCDTSTLSAVYASLAADSPPEAFWAGYDTARLISVGHWDQWLHTTRPLLEGADFIRIRPRRWTDIYGSMIKEDWKRCVRGVVGHVSNRPGMLLADLRAKSGIAMDRMELNEVIQYLEDVGAVRRAWVGEAEKSGVPPIEAIDEDEEGKVAYWSVKPWNIG